MVRDRAHFAAPPPPSVSCAQTPANVLRDMDVQELQSLAHPRTVLALSGVFLRTRRKRAPRLRSPGPPCQIHLHYTATYVQACLLHSYTHTDTYINTPHHTTHTDTHQHTQTDTGRTLPTHSRLPQTVGWSLQLVHSSAALLRTTSREYCMFMSTRRLICALMLWVMLHPPTRNIVTFRLQSMPRRSARPPRSSTA